MWLTTLMNSSETKQEDAWSSGETISTKKNLGNFLLFRFSGIVGMKINSLLVIENIDILCCYNFNDKTKYIWYQILVG